MTALRNRSSDAMFLCYHSVNVEGPRWLTVPPSTFRRQLAGLRARGYRAGGPADLGAMTDGRRPDRPLCFLTFDDGFRDNYEQALPVLEEHGLTAWCFVLPPLLDGGGALEWAEVGEDAARFPSTMRSVTWRMVEQMSDAGMQIGSHGLTHAHLPGLDDDALTRELRESRASLVDRLGYCDAFAYPFGHWDERVARAAAEAGYSFAFTMPRGAQKQAESLSIPRVAVDHRDSRLRFRLKTSATGRRLMLSPAKALVRRLRPFAGRGGSTQ